MKWGGGGKEGEVRRDSGTLGQGSAAGIIL